MKRVVQLFCILLLISFGISCGTSKDIGKAEAAVANVHAQLNAGSFQQIYKDSDDSFKSATSQEHFIAILDAVHRKLGTVQSAEREGFFVNYGTTGEMIRLNYSTRFDTGTADEQFVFRVSGNEARLVGYHINSDLLITK